MKVRELQKGMIVKPIKDWEFVIHDAYATPNPWLHVRMINRRSGYGRHFRPRPLDRSTDERPVQLAVYVGRKCDVGKTAKVSWSDRFVLYKNRVIAVDPAAWRRIEVVDETR